MFNMTNAGVPQSASEWFEWPSAEEWTFGKVPFTSEPKQGFCHPNG